MTLWAPDRRLVDVTHGGWATQIPAGRAALYVGDWRNYVLRFQAPIALGYTAALQFGWLNDRGDDLRDVLSRNFHVANAQVLYETGRILAPYVRLVAIDSLLTTNDPAHTWTMQLDVTDRELHNADFHPTDGAGGSYALVQSPAAGTNVADGTTTRFELRPYRGPAIAFGMCPAAAGTASVRIVNQVPGAATFEPIAEIYNRTAPVVDGAPTKIYLPAGRNYIELNNASGAVQTFRYAVIPGYGHTS